MKDEIGSGEFVDVNSLQSIFESIKDSKKSVTGTKSGNGFFLFYPAC